MAFSMVRETMVRDHVHDAPPPPPPIIYLYILKYEMHPLLYPYKVRALEMRGVKMALHPLR